MSYRPPPAATPISVNTFATPSTGAAAARRAALSDGANTLSIAATGAAVSVKFGTDNTVDASSDPKRIVARGEVADIGVPPNATHYSVSSSADFTLYVNQGVV